jgi:hypothetical protein
VKVIDVHQLPRDPLEALRELSQREAQLGRLRREAIEAARAQGATWEQVGAALGVSRQAAWEYYSRTVRERLAEVAGRSQLTDDDALELAVDEARAARRERRR